HDRELYEEHEQIESALGVLDPIRRFEIFREGKLPPGGALQVALETRGQVIAEILRKHAVTRRRAATPASASRAIAASLDRDTALIELVKFDAAMFGANVIPAEKQPRYAAYVIKHDGPVSFVPLSDAGDIDDLAGLVRESVGEPLIPVEDV